MAVCLPMTYEVQSLSELIIRVFGGERGDSCVGGPFKKSTANLGRRSYWGCWSSLYLQLSLSGAWDLHGVLMSHIYTHTHRHTCTSRWPESCAYISHPLCYDQFPLLACVQLSVQPLQESKGSVSNSPTNPSFIPCLLNGPDVDQ